MQVDFPRWTYKKEFTDIGITVTSEGNAIYTITEGDPLSAAIRCDEAISIARDGWSTRIETTSVLTADAESFLVTDAVDAYEGDRHVFSRRSTASIPRDHV